jgi:lysophospholipase L1-like esterase
VNRIDGLLRYYGLRKPYDLATAGLVLACVLFLVFLACAALVWYLSGELTLWSPRSRFVAYLMGTLLAAALLSRRHRLAMVLLCWCLLEFGLATTTALASRWGWGASRFPRNHTAEARFEYHALLQKVPKPGFGGVEGRTTASRKVRVKHNSDGFRGAEVQALGAETRLIIAYGGSSTYDIAVDQGRTWVEELERRLGPRYTVLNFGVPGYTTQEHLIQTAFYGEFRGRRPACALYYIGWNDIRNAHIPDLDPGYADFHALGQLDNFRIREAWLDPVSFSPVVLMLAQWLQTVTSVIPLPPDVGEPLDAPASDPRLDAIYRSNVAALVALNRSRQVIPIFIGQLLNKAEFTADRSSAWIPRVQSRHVWDLQAHFNEVLEAQAALLGAAYIDPGIDRFEDADFADEGHFSEAGARKFAGIVYPKVAELCH